MTDQTVRPGLLATRQPNDRTTRGLDDEETQAKATASSMAMANGLKLIHPMQTPLSRRVDDILWPLRREREETPRWNRKDVHSGRYSLLAMACVEPRHWIQSMFMCKVHMHMHALLIAPVGQ